MVDIMRNCLFDNEINRFKMQKNSQFVLNFILILDKQKVYNKCYCVFLKMIDKQLISYTIITLT